MTALNGPQIKTVDTPSMKIGLLMLLRENAKSEGSYGHTAVDNGSGRCTVCSRPGAYYGPPNDPNARKTFQHKRGWSGRAKRSKVDLTVNAIAQRLGTSEHTVAHLLWSLQKQGLVTFRESKGNTPGAKTVGLENIRLTTLGLSPARRGRTPEDRIREAEGQVSVNGMYRPDDTTDSDTDIANDVAVEGLIDKAMTWVREPQVTEVESEPEPEPEPVVSSVEPDGETPEPKPDHLPTTLLVNGDRYPALLELLSREGKRRAAIEATALLEKAGLTDLALQSITAIPDNKPLEQEVIDYLTEIGVRP